MTSGTTDKVTGKAKEVAGKVTGDENTQAEGKADQVKGEAKNAAQDVKDAATGGDSDKKE